MVFLFFTDNYGRKFSAIMAWGFTVAGVILICLAQNIYMAMVGLFIFGGGSEASIRISMSVFGEIVDYYLRQRYSVALEIAFGAGGVAVGAA